MEQFNLDKWLQNKSRKVVTRDGRKVRILCWDAENSKPIIALVQTISISQRGFDGLTVSYFNDGTYYGGATEDFLDLFFADEEEELTEFEKAIRNILVRYISNIDDFPETIIREAKSLLDLARKEILKDLPKWKRDCFHNINSVFDNILYYNDYYIDINGLEKLPKEEQP